MKPLGTNVHEADAASDTSKPAPRKAWQPPTLIVGTYGRLADAANGFSSYTDAGSTFLPS